MNRTLFLFLLFCCNSFAQTISEIKYTGNLNIKYTCLLVYYNDDECYARIRFVNANNELRTVHIEYKGISGKLRNGESYFSLDGMNCEDLSNNKNIRNCLPNNFVWINNEDIPYQTPMKVENDGRWVLKSVDNFRKIDIADLTPSYLKLFYNENDQDYKSLLKIREEILLPKVINTSDKPSSLHLIVLANTDINDIGKGCEIDMINLDNEFSEMAKTLNIDYDPHLIYVKNFSKNTLLNEITNLNVNENDIVIFVYRGHGFRWDNQVSKFPSLSLTRAKGIPISNDNTILLEDIYNKIKSKQARLNIVLGDCCNSYIGANQWTTDNYLYMQSTFSAQYEKLNQLFLNSRGNLIFAASTEGEVSWTNSFFGGFFTTSFMQAFVEECSYLKSSKTSWQNIISNTNQYAINKSTKCAECTIQHAIFDSSIENE